MTKTRKAFDADGVQFAWDSTSIGIAEACLRKYQYAILDGWTSPNKSVHLLFGGWYASALESFHQYRASGMDFDEAVCEIVADALSATWEFDEDGTGGHPWTSLDNLKTRENLIRTIVWYTEQFRDDAAHTLILSNGKAAVEQSFRFDVDDGIVFCGHLDRLVEYAHHPYVQDQKTTKSTITPRYFDNYSPDTQMSMYSFAGKIIWKAPVKGVMIDAAQIAVGFSRFERGFAFRSEAQLNEWYDSSMYHIEAARKATRENFFPMNRASCSNYGGCEFRGVCARSPEVRPQFLKGDFEQSRRWDPLEVRG